MSKVQLSPELDSTALTIYASMPADFLKTRPEQCAVTAFQAAAKFLSVREKLHSGEINVPVVEESLKKYNPWMCPNQPPENPHNMIARPLHDQTPAAVEARRGYLESYGENEESLKRILSGRAPDKEWNPEEWPRAKKTAKQSSSLVQQ